MLSQDWSAVSQTGSTIVSYAIANLPSMITKFQAAAVGQLQGAVVGAATSSTSVDGAQDAVAAAITSPANMFAMGQIAGEIFAGMLRATLPASS
jgi:hypothetical protein